jgi:hypothetical protein
VRSRRPDSNRGPLHYERKPEAHGRSHAPTIPPQIPQIRVGARRSQSVPGDDLVDVRWTLRRLRRMPRRSAAPCRCCDRVRFRAIAAWWPASNGRGASSSVGGLSSNPLRGALRRRGRPPCPAPAPSRQASAGCGLVGWVELVSRTVSWAEAGRFSALRRRTAWSGWRDPSSNRGHHDFQASGVLRVDGRNACKAAVSEAASAGASAAFGSGFRAFWATNLPTWPIADRAARISRRRVRAGARGR